MDTLKQNLLIAIFTGEFTYSDDAPDIDELLAKCIDDESGVLMDLIPPYTSDLNAMHEAEQKLDAPQCNAYNSALVGVKHGPKTANTHSQRWTWGTSAKQRAEAFLRVIGKWEESEP